MCRSSSTPILYGFGPCPEVEGLYFNLGYSGHGVMGAPEGSRYVVAMITGQMSAADNAFGCHRFAAGERVAGEQMVI